MYISKKNRELVKNLFGGKCAYTGTELLPDWQIDHVDPVVRNWWTNTVCYPDAHKVENMIPAQRIINHYKHSMDLEQFRAFMMDFHNRLKRYPKNPIIESSVKRKAYVMEIARLFGITPQNPFPGKFWFENIMTKKLCGFNGGCTMKGKDNSCENGLYECNYLIKPKEQISAKDLLKWLSEERNILQNTGQMMLPDQAQKDTLAMAESLDKTIKYIELAKNTVNLYCECDFAMIRRCQKTQKAYCFECKKEIKE